MNLFYSETSSHVKLRYKMSYKYVIIHVQNTFLNMSVNESREHNYIVLYLNSIQPSHVKQTIIKALRVLVGTAALKFINKEVVS